MTNDEGALKAIQFYQRSHELATDNAVQAVKFHKLLEEHLEPQDTPCRYDFNGFCQEHWSSQPCLVQRTREALGR